MSNGYFLADTNSLVYAYRAGGPKLLDTYREMARAEDRKFAITKTVSDEIKKGPLNAELLRYIADKNIRILDNPQTEQRLRVGEITSKNAGEESIVENAKREHAAGRSTPVLSDDRYFASPQKMREAPGVQPATSAELLNQAREDRFISESKYREYLAGYQAQPEFRAGSASYSPRLNAFDPHHPTLIERAGERLGDPRTAQIGLKVIGAGFVMHDILSTGQKTIDLLNQGNLTGAQSEVLHFGGRNGGMVGGAALGAYVGGAIASVPGTVVGSAAGLIGGAIVGDKIMDAVDRARIYTQRGSDGNDWNLDPSQPAQGWTRLPRPGEFGLQGPPEGAGYKNHLLPAAPRLADELNYKASSMAVDLALAHPPAPQDPFRQAPETIGETVRPGIGASQPWMRDPQSHAWTRQATEAPTTMTHGMPVQRTVTASAEQSRQLDAAAQRVIADNIAHSPQGIAQCYQEAYGQHGWRQHGPVPAAVINAAQGHVREELNATRQPMPAQPQPTSGPLTPQQIERITTHESRIVPTPGGMSFAEAHQRRDEPEQISPGSLQPVGKLDASHRAKGSPLYRMHQAQEQDLMRGLGIAQAQDRERFRNEPSLQQRPSVERTQDRTHRHLLEEVPVQKQLAPPVPAVQTPPPTRGEHAMAPSAAADIAAAQAQVAAAQAELAEMRQQMARMAGQRGQGGLERRDGNDPKEATQPPAATSRPELRIDHPGHPGHELFQQAREHMRALDARMGRSSDERTDNMAACLAVQACRSGLERIDGVDIGTSGKDVWMAQGPLGTVWMKVAGVPVESADVPVQQTSQGWEQAQQFAQQQQADKHQEQQEHQRVQQQGNEHLVPSR